MNLKVFCFHTLLVAFLTVSCPIQAENSTALQADSAYNAGDYLLATELYEEVLKSGRSADLYYNLGNAYYRQENITRAVLSYERAALLAPGNKDIAFNLQLARSKTIDRVTPEPEMFFVTAFRSLESLQGADGWAVTLLVSFALCLALMLLYFFAESVGLRKAGFFGALAALVVVVFSGIFAYAENERQTHPDTAIVIDAAAPVRSTPAKDGTSLFVLHEGTKVNIKDDSMADWYEVSLADGKQGWIETKAIERI